jgi:murein DD-endopeptidase MepM/ murein hydrolase activator NlpD
LKRTLPQKVKLVPSCVTEIEVDAGQPKQTLPEVNRRARTSAAMIGLALSMGAHSLLLARPGDSAMAAEPVASEPTATASPSVSDAIALASDANAASQDATSAASDATVIEHTIREGQTVFQLSQLYGVDAVSIANANRIPVSSVLQVGQVLRIPTSNRIAHASPTTSQADATASLAPEYYGPISSQPATSAAADNPEKTDVALKAEQDAAITQLQTKRESLRLSLSQLKASQPAESLTVAAQPTDGKPTPSPEPKVPANQAVAALPAPAADAAEPDAPAIRTQVTAQKTVASSNPGTPVSEQPTQTDNSTTVATIVPTVIEPAAPTETATYRVTVGDTLSSIARRHGVPLQQLIEANKLDDPNIIRADQELVIPQLGATATVNQPFTVASASSAVSSAAKLPNVPVIGSSTSSSSAATTGAAPFQTVPSLAVPPVSMTSRAVAADQQVSIVPSTQQRDASPGDESNSSGQSDYVEGLRQEILKLREKYQATPVNTTATGTVPRIAAIQPAGAASPTPERMNPEFNSAGAELAQPKVIKPDFARPATSRRAPELAPAATRSKPQRVATAPIGSQNYAPLVPSTLGQMVSPDLPPLGSVDAYVPRGSQRFAGYIWPAKGVLTSGYGWRWGRMHRGIDIAAPIGTPVVAAAPGVVTYSGWNAGGYGNLVEITHPDGSVTLYAHNDRNLVREGQEVAQGQQIAEMGSTGYSTGPHSHFEVHLPGQGAVNPMAYLPREGAS